VQTAEAIGSLSFFQGLSATQQEKLESISHLEHYEKGYILHYEQSRSSRLFFLVEGLAKAYKIDKYQNEIFLYLIYPDTMLSELSSLHVAEISAYSNISIEESSLLLSIDFRRFRTEFLEAGLLTLEVAQEVIRQSRQMRDILNREFIFDSVSKVALMLDNDLEIFNRLKRYDVSLMLHIQPATLSRVLNRLKRDEIIDILKGKVEIRDPRRLAAIYKGTL